MSDRDPVDRARRFSCGQQRAEFGIVLAGGGLAEEKFERGGGLADEHL